MANIKIIWGNEPGFLQDGAASQREGRRKLPCAPGKSLFLEQAAAAGRNLLGHKHLQRDQAGEIGFRRDAITHGFPTAAAQALKPRAERGSWTAKYLVDLVEFRREHHLGS